MSNSKHFAFTAGILMMMMMLLNVGNAGAIPCSEAAAILAPCVGYLRGITPDTPSSQCCSACHNLLAQSQDKEDKQQICYCLKRLAPSIGVNPVRATQLPLLCNISTGFPITPDIDCNKISETEF
ncbi:hypothetical protein Dimus_022031 [Dionaea muscipula]